DDEITELAQPLQVQRLRREGYALKETGRGGERRARGTFDGVSAALPHLEDIIQQGPRQRAVPVDEQQMIPGKALEPGLGVDQLVLALELLLVRVQAAMNVE